MTMVVEKWQWRGDVDDEVGAGRVRCGSGCVGQGLDMGQPFWAARLDTVPGSIGVPFPTERSSAGNTCLGA